MDGGQDLRNVQKHLLLTLTASGRLDKARAAALDLDSTAGLVLDVLDVRATMADHLCAQVEARERLEADWDFLLGPFALSES